MDAAVFKIAAFLTCLYLIVTTGHWIFIVLLAVVVFATRRSRSVDDADDSPK